MAKVAAYVLAGSGLAQRVVPLLAAGARAVGDTVDVYAASQYKAAHSITYDACIFWGYVAKCQQIMSDFNDNGTAPVYLDLAYWKRDTHYKVSVGDRHPTAYFQNIEHPGDRSKRFGLAAHAYNNCERGHILLAGMSEKAAWAEKLEPAESWERSAIAELRKHTDRDIVYRPKRPGATPIEGVSYNDPRSGLPLRGAYAVVAHHSNVAVDGLIEGIPAFVKKGVASAVSHHDLALINDPKFVPVDLRQQWLNDVAYCQWSLDELSGGACWTHLKNEGLVK